MSLAGVSLGGVLASKNRLRFAQHAQGITNARNHTSVPPRLSGSEVTTGFLDIKNKKPLKSGNKRVIITRTTTS
jgi:hypothetical protein